LTFFWWKPHLDQQQQVAVIMFVVSQCCSQRPFCLLHRPDLYLKRCYKYHHPSLFVSSMVALNFCDCPQKKQHCFQIVTLADKFRSFSLALLILTILITVICLLEVLLSIVIDIFSFLLSKNIRWKIPKK
jgi:hypothetical protein